MSLSITVCEITTRTSQVKIQTKRKQTTSLIQAKTTLSGELAGFNNLDQILIKNQQGIRESAINIYFKCRQGEHIFGNEKYMLLLEKGEKIYNKSFLDIAKRAKGKLFFEFPHNEKPSDYLHCLY